ncbi:MAG: hypothetical protein SGJ27_19385 [Candidatus Melainabacteria bacterium]|nr:hypothetical protein [Candidatus Melainabacteria bacterium]
MATKQKSIKTTLALLLAASFLIDACPTADAQQGGGRGGMRGAGAAFNAKGGKAVEYGKIDDYHKLDRDGNIPETPQDPSKENKPVTVYEDDVAEIDDADPVREGQIKLVATIAVPHLKKSLTQVTAYPYPMKPPPAKQKIRLLPDKDKQLKNMILSSGYLSRSAGDTPYPPGGWRWQYAFNKAVKNSNLTIPHSIFEHYIWADRVMPFVKAQIKLYNAFERTRVTAYNAAQQDFLDNRTQFEDEATKAGVGPTSLKHVYLRSGKIGLHYANNLKPGKWWILATHRVPGLKYFWLLPIDIDKSERVILNESNAIYVEGGW